MWTGDTALCAAGASKGGLCVPVLSLWLSLCKCARCQGFSDECVMISLFWFEGSPTSRRGSRIRNDTGTAPGDTGHNGVTRGSLGRRSLCLLLRGSDVCGKASPQSLVLSLNTVALGNRSPKKYTLTNAPAASTGPPPPTFLTEVHSRQKALNSGGTVEQ